MMTLDDTLHNGPKDSSKTIHISLSEPSLSKVQISFENHAIFVNKCASQQAVLFHTCSTKSLLVNKGITSIRATVRLIVSCKHLKSYRKLSLRQVVCDKKKIEHVLSRTINRMVFSQFSEL